MKAFFAKYWLGFVLTFMLTFLSWPHVSAYLEGQKELEIQNQAVAKVRANQEASRESNSVNKIGVVPQGAGGVLNQSLAGSDKRDKFLLKNSVTEFKKINKNVDTTNRKVTQMSRETDKKLADNKSFVETRLEEMQAVIDSQKMMIEEFTAKNNERVEAVEDKVGGIDKLVKTGGITGPSGVALDLDALDMESLEGEQRDAAPGIVEAHRASELMVQREHLSLWESDSGSLEVGNAEAFEVDPNSIPRAVVTLPFGSVADAVLDHRMAISVNDSSKECIFTLKSKFTSVGAFAVDFREMKVKGVTRVKLTGEGVGTVEVQLSEIQLVLDKGECFTRPIKGFVECDTVSGYMEGKNITKIAKPLFKNFFLDFATITTEGIANSYSDTVRNTDGDMISRVEPGDEFKQGIGKGVSGSMSEVKDTYKAQWGDIVPTIAIKKGTPVKIKITEQIQFPDLKLDHFESTNLSQLY